MRNYKKNTTFCPMLAEVKLTYKAKIKKSDRAKISTPNDCFKYLLSIWDENDIDHHETAFILMLNISNEVLGWAKISSGGINSTIIDPMIVFQYALLHNAKSIILAHNHPSGKLIPSNQDINITKKINDGSKLLDIDLLDHLIITSEGYTSMKDEGHF